MHLYVKPIKSQNVWQNTAGLLKKETMQPNAVVIYLIENTH